jgi:hypothetical protein
MKFHENPSSGSGVVYVRTDDKPDMTKQIGGILFEKAPECDCTLQASYATYKYIQCEKYVFSVKCDGTLRV